MATDYRAAVEAKLRAMTLGPNAAAWVMKALDPVRGGPEKIPDANQVSTLNPEYKTSMVINAPPGVGTSNWDALIIVPPSDTVAAFIATNVTGIDFGTTVASVNTYLANTTVNMSADNQIRAGGFNTVTGAAVVPGNFRSAYSSEQPVAWRTAARSMTCYSTGSDLYNQGTIYAGTYARRTIPNLAQALDTGGPIQHVVVNTAAVSLPLRESDMAAMTPGFYASPAREGVYVVSRLTGPAQEFSHAQVPTQWRAVDGMVEYVNITDTTNANSLTGMYPRFLQDNFVTMSPSVPPSSGTGCVSTSFDDRCTWTVIIARALHPSQSLTLKSFVTLEIIPAAMAPSRQFVSPPAKYEPTALAAYYAIASEMPYAMPGKYNFLGAILPAISAVASKVLPFLAPIAGQALTSLGAAVSQRAAAPKPTPVEHAPPVIRPARSPSVASRVSRTSVMSRRSARKVKIRKPRKR